MTYLFAHPTEEGDLGIKRIFPEAILTRKMWIMENSWGLIAVRFHMGRSSHHITLTDDNNDWEVRIIKLNEEGEITFPKNTPLKKDKFGWMNTFGVEGLLQKLKAEPDPYNYDGNQKWALEYSAHKEAYEDAHPHDHQDDVDERMEHMDHFVEQGLATEYHQMTGDYSTVQY